MQRPKRKVQRPNGEQSPRNQSRETKTSPLQWGQCAGAVPLQVPTRVRTPRLTAHVKAYSSLDTAECRPLHSLPLRARHTYTPRHTLLTHFLHTSRPPSCLARSVQALGTLAYSLACSLLLSCSRTRDPFSNSNGSQLHHGEFSRLWGGDRPAPRATWCHWGLHWRRWKEVEYTPAEQAVVLVAHIVVERRPSSAQGEIDTVVRAVKVVIARK
jgi:hypothetical protein